MIDLDVVEWAKTLEHAVTSNLPGQPLVRSLAAFLATGSDSPSEKYLSQ